MAPTSDGRGYWLVGDNGSVYAFGDATFHGDASKLPLNAGVVGMAATPDDGGYWLAASDGGVFTFGDAPYEGSSADGPAVTPVSTIIASEGGAGYSLLAPDAFAVDFANPPSAPDVRGCTVGGAGRRFPGGARPRHRVLLQSVRTLRGVVLALRHVGDGAGRRAHSVLRLHRRRLRLGGGQRVGASPSAMPAPGDAVLYGTGPADTDTSVHVGIVAQVWPDGAIDTVEGDAGPGNAGSLAVVINGPFLPSDSLDYNGFGIYAYVQG